MPFLFVDYNSGAGGEYFCHVISQAPECVTLTAQTFKSGRTKINDLFNQEFLKPHPIINNTIQSSATLYDIIPAHRTTPLAMAKLDKIFSIRISGPLDLISRQFLWHQKINKVLLAVEPTSQYFIGQLKLLQKKYNNKKFVKKVNKSMDNLSLILLAMNQEPTLENRQKYLNNMYIYNMNSYNTPPEPDCHYDLVIPYKTLLSDPTWIARNLAEKFNITISAAPFEKYRNEYQQFQTST